MSLTWGRRSADPWLDRFGAVPPTFALELLEVVRRAGSHLPAEAHAAAGALGVLRAQQGHAVAGLVEDLAALRDVVPDTGSGSTGRIDSVLAVAVSAFVDELTALLSSHARKDPLTGLPNRAAFDETLSHELANAQRGGAPSLLLIDLDRFKLVNDTDGHLAGDAVLVAVADVLGRVLRAGDVACRLGGDEFAVILPRTSSARAAQVAQRLLRAARRADGLSSAHARVSMSIGIACDLAAREPAQLVALADAALYRVKDAGGDGAQHGTSGVEATAACA